MGQVFFYKRLGEGQQASKSMRVKEVSKDLETMKLFCQGHLMLGVSMTKTTLSNFCHCLTHGSFSNQTSTKFLDAVAISL